MDRVRYLSIMTDPFFILIGLGTKCGVCIMKWTGLCSKI
jgi:hypothetical protein